MDIIDTILNIIYPIIAILVIVMGVYLIILIISLIDSYISNDAVFFDDDGNYFELNSFYRAVKILNNYIESDADIIISKLDKDELYDIIKKHGFSSCIDPVEKSVLIRIVDDNNIFNIYYPKDSILNKIYYKYFSEKITRRY